MCNPLPSLVPYQYKLITVETFLCNEKILMLLPILADSGVSALRILPNWSLRYINKGTKNSLSARDRLESLEIGYLV